MIRRYDCLDMFAGRRAISKAYAAEGLKCVALDLELNAADATSPFEHAVLFA